MNENKQKEEIIKTSLVINRKGEYPKIYEQIYDKERKRVEYVAFPLSNKLNYDCEFVKITDNEKLLGYDIYVNKNESVGFYKKTDCVYNDNEILCKPIDDEEIYKNVVFLPSDIKRFKTEEELDNKIIQFINKWLDIDDNYKYIAVQNIKSFWLYDKFETINYLRALGDTGTGKSRFLNTFGFLAYKPLFCSGSTTVSPIFRLITKWGGTVIIDEADLKKSDESEDLVKLLNQGYEKNASILRCNPNDKSKIDFFNPYCPKIIATRKTFQDKAVESRCMTTLMRQTTRKDIPFNLNQDFYNDSLEIRNMLLYYRLINYSKINTSFCEISEIKERMQKFEPRLQQVNNILLCLFSNNKEQLEQFFTYMEHKQEEIIKERSDSFEGWIVNVISELIIENCNGIEPYPYITSQDIAIRLNQNEGRQHHEYNTRSIGKYLKTLGFVVVTKRFGTQTKKVIIFEKSKEPINIFKRYVFEQEIINKINDIFINKCFVVSNVSLYDVHYKNETNPENTEKGESGLYTVTNETNETTKHNTKQEIIKKIKENPKDNANMINLTFSKYIIDDMIQKGDIYENPKGTYHFID